MGDSRHERQPPLPQRWLAEQMAQTAISAVWALKQVPAERRVTHSPAALGSGRLIGTFSPGFLRVDCRPCGDQRV
ncbi:MAG: hypothetical protein R3300_11860 [Candidatus Promineifilaceae bacterium]|nr:hypothetical protein [Candidatus Promineifilaceae bacterium]